jgi:hypothetical protein
MSATGPEGTNTISATQNIMSATGPEGTNTISATSENQISGKSIFVKGNIWCENYRYCNVNLTLQNVSVANQDGHSLILCFNTHEHKVFMLPFKWMPVYVSITYGSMWATMYVTVCMKKFVDTYYDITDGKGVYTTEYILCDKQKFACCSSKLITPDVAIEANEGWFAFINCYNKEGKTPIIRNKGDRVTTEFIVTIWGTQC